MVYKMQLEDYFCYLYTFLLTILSVIGLKYTLQSQKKERSLSLGLYDIRLSRNMDMLINKRIRINCCILRNVSHYRAVDRKNDLKIPVGVQIQKPIIYLFL